MLCKGKTKAGIPCKNTAMLDGYCKMHYPDVTSRQDDLTKLHRDIVRYVDPIKSLRNSMRLIDPIKEYLKTMKHIDPMAGLQDSIKIPDPIKEYLGAMKHIDPVAGLQDSMKIPDPIKEYLGAMKHIDPVAGLQDSMKIPDPIKEYLEAIKHIDPMKSLQESIKFILPSERFKDAIGATKLWNQFDSLHHLIVDLKSTINTESISSLIKEVRAITTQAGIIDFGTEPSITPDGTLAFSLDSMGLQPLHDAGSQVILNAIQSQSSNIVEVIQKLIAEVRSLKDSKIQNILIQLIFPVVLLLVGIFFTPVADFYVKNYLTNCEKKRISTQLKQSVISNVQAKEALRYLRYVKADVLSVRKNKSKSSQLIGYLYFGQVAEILEKRKDWSLIKWMDETGEISIEGWVFTRYLANFK